MSVRTCEICGREIDSRGYNNHVKRCKENKNQISSMKHEMVETTIEDLPTIIHTTTKVPPNKEEPNKEEWDGFLWS